MDGIQIVLHVSSISYPHPSFLAKEWVMCIHVFLLVLRQEAKEKILLRNGKGNLTMKG